jgi:hypothetical protein
MNLIFVSRQEITHSLSLWFRERLCAHKAFSFAFCQFLFTVSIFSLSPPEAIVSIDIDTRLGSITRVIAYVHIFSFLDKYTRFDELILNVFSSINIDRRDEHKSILLDILLKVSSFMNDSTWIRFSKV